MKKATLFHAVSPVCVEAEQQILNALDKNRFDIEAVNLGEDLMCLNEAEHAGIQSVSALLLDGVPFHINYGASLADVKGGA